MATKRWSASELLGEFRDLQASAMSLDITGSLALLAGRKASWIFQVSDPRRGMVKIPRKSVKWDGNIDTGCHCLWNPNPSSGNVFSLANSPLAEIYTFDNSRVIEKTTLNAHTRSITDQDWSRFDSNAIVTCSSDSFIYVWDIREPRTPKIALESLQRPFQVKWNKVKEGILATSHDRDIRLWDIRRGDRPIRYISGHLQKIYGLDWSAAGDGALLASASLDGTVAVWDTLKDSAGGVKDMLKHELSLPYGCPFWRARFTPFEGSLLTVIVPQERRVDNNLLLYDLDSLRRPGIDPLEQHAFVGHSDVVYDFHWRKTGDVYQLISWSRDQTLRLWEYNAPVKTYRNEGVLMNGITVGRGGDEAANASEHTSDYAHRLISSASSLRSDATLVPQRLSDSGASTTDGSSSSSSTVNCPPAPVQRVASERCQASATPGSGSSISALPDTRMLHSEFQLVSDVENVHVIESDTQRRACVVLVACSRRHTEHTVRVAVTFPPGYPDGGEPLRFQFDAHATALDPNALHNLDHDVDQMSQQHARLRRRSLEPCIRLLKLRLDERGGCNIGDASMSSLSGRSLSAEGDAGPRSYSFSTASYSSSAAASAAALYRGSSGSLVSTLTVASPPLVSAQDIQMSVPIPRTCGAVFCSAGTLVVFHRVGVHSAGMSSVARGGGARFLSDGLATQAKSPGPMKGYYSQLSRSPKSDHQGYERGTTSSRRKVRDDGRGSRMASSSAAAARKDKCGPILVYDVAALLPVSKALALKYAIPLRQDELIFACRHNAEAAAQVGRKDLVPIWNMLESIVTDETEDDGRVNTMHGDDPPGASSPVLSIARHTVQTIMEHYATLNDVQTLAMICCMLSLKQRLERFDDLSQVRRAPVPPLIRLGSRSLTGLPALTQSKLLADSATTNPEVIYQSASDSVNGSWTHTKSRHSESLSGSLESEHRLGSYRTPDDVETQQRTNDAILDSSFPLLHESYLAAYGDLLLKWGLINTRATVLGFMSINSPLSPVSANELSTRLGCARCGSEYTGAAAPGSCCISEYASGSSDCLLRCSVCHLPVRGSLLFCFSCQHGGHLSHLFDWFSRRNCCPTGCGCDCRVANMGR